MTEDGTYHSYDPEDDMTAEGLVASLAWSAVAGYAAWRADLRIAQWLYARFKSEAPTEPSRSGKPASRLDVTVPDDLIAYANEWRDQFARDDVVASIKDKFLELHTGDSDETWQKVRHAVGIAEMP